jgi:pyruvate-formate lyase-activating enzyme/SAM-dependent methyltransferase
MKALIKVGYGCNNHCTFCHTLDVRDVEGSSREVHAKIDRAARLGHTMVVLSGGEVTMRPELLQWAAHAASLGLDFGLVTNGRMLAYRELVEKLLGYRLKYVYMSLHGGDAKVHNLMVRADAFEQTYAAIGNLSGRGLDFTVNAVVTRHNVKHLRPIVDAILPYPDVVLKFSMVQPKGGGDRLFDHLMPRVSDVARAVHEAITYGRQKASAQGPRFAHDGIPFCLLPGYEDLYDDLKTHRFATMVEIGEPDFFPVDDLAKTQSAQCHGCALRGPCPGLYTGYYQVYGDGELAPVTDRPRSNSFNYVYERVVARLDGGGCPILADGITPWDRGRHLFVRKGAVLARFRTDSRDFTDAEIAAIKHDHGQVYLDVSGKDAPDDFARDLVQLRRSAMCAPCPERDRCAGIFEPVRSQVFTRDDARVRALLGDIAGDVLDVGCGEGPYEDVLAPRARAGAIRYVGLEPDPRRVAALRARWPWAEVREGTAEEGVADEGRFDHVLVLRSWNHLRDPARALAALVRALRPGGTLTIVDNIAFGLARTKPHAARAETSAAGFEHYRNDAAADAHRLVAPLGLELLERRDVSPATSNQWLLRYRVPASGVPRQIATSPADAVIP